MKSMTITSEPGLQLLQFATRSLLALLAALYFSHVPGFYLPLPFWTLWVLLAAYASTHLLLLLYRDRRSAGLAGPGIDLLALGMLLLLDPGDPPPTLALIIVAILSIGLLRGLQRFLWALLSTTLLLAAVFSIRHLFGSEPLSAASLFLMATLAISVIYFMLLLYRNKLLARQAQEATWQDPETGLISGMALAHTAGWLFPLHDRLASTLSIALVRADSAESFDQLARSIQERLRRSDIAARHDERSVLVLLPCTDQKKADLVLSEIKARTGQIRAACMTLDGTNAAMDVIGRTLEETLARTDSSRGDWLAHGVTHRHA